MGGLCSRQYLLGWAEVSNIERKQKKKVHLVRILPLTRPCTDSCCCCPPFVFGGTAGGGQGWVRVSDGRR